MPQMRFMADAEHAVILGKRAQYVEEIFRRCVRQQFGTWLGAFGKAERFFGKISGLSGPEIGAAQDVRGGDAEPNKAFHGFPCFLDALSGQRTRVIFLLPVSPLNGNAMSE